MSDPTAIAMTAFEHYDRTGREAYLLHALSLLESWGAAAWPVLRWIAKLQRPECELFAGLIVRSSGAPQNERLEVLGSLADNPNSSVRLSLIEHLSSCPVAEVKGILTKLTSDPDPEIRTEANERLKSVA
jgi:hypothetical protein